MSASAKVEAKKSIHVRVWSGGPSAAVTEMANAGRGGKTCRRLRFSYWDGAPRETPGHGEALFFLRETLPRLTGEESFDDVATMGRALVALAKHFEMHEEQIRGVDAPLEPVSAEGPGWSLSASEDGVCVADLADRANEPRSISRGAPARAHAIAKRVVERGIPAGADFSAVVRLLSDAGASMHTYCAVD